MQAIGKVKYDNCQSDSKNIQYCCCWN